MAVIEDGAGRGFVARVNSDNRLYTFADSVPAGTIAASSKRMWNVSSGDVNLTTDGYSGVLYLKYTGNKALILSRLNVTADASTGGSGNTTVQVKQNPTTGTLITDQTAATVTNRNFAGTAGSLTGTQYKGAEGKTVTDGTTVGELSVSQGLSIFNFVETPLVLETGNSISFEVKPPTGNTSQDVRVFAIFYELVVL